MHHFIKIKGGAKEEDVPNIYRYPEIINALPSNAQLTIGDLHGNTLALLYYLIREGVIGVDKDSYLKLARIYLSTHPQKQVNGFKEFFKQIKILRHDIKIVLIGDETADRGTNDFLTLLTLEALSALNITILLSNHGKEFVHAYEKLEKFEGSTLRQDFIRSMTALQQTISKGVVTRAEVIELINQVYKPKLQILFYSLDESKEQITIYSHAPIGINTIEKMAEQLGIIFKGDTARNLAQTINAINIVFKAYVDNNLVHTLYKPRVVELAATNEAATDEEIKKRLLNNPFVVAMWNRCYEEDFIQRPNTIRWVAGHDSAETEEPSLQKEHIYCVDNSFGKGTVFFSYDSPYIILISEREHILEPSPEIIAETEPLVAAVKCKASAIKARSSSAGATDQPQAETDTPIIREEPVDSTQRSAQSVFEVTLIIEEKPLTVTPIVSIQESVSQGQAETTPIVKEDASALSIIPPPQGSFSQTEGETLFPVEEELSEVLTDSHFLKQEKILFAKLDQLKDKANNPLYKMAAQTAEALHRDLMALKTQLTNKQISLSQFKTGYKKAIDGAKEELSKHRGLGKVLSALAKVLNTLIYYGTFKLSSNRFFVIATDSNKKLSAVQNNPCLRSNRSFTR